MAASNKSWAPRVPHAAHAALQKKLGYEFRDQALLLRAMTHSSAEAKFSGLADNERLEFLGDRVLGLMTAEALFNKFPGAEEGALAPRLNTLVRKETLAEVAEEVSLGDCLVLAEGEVKSGGRRKAGLLADACEALIAALYLDGGIKAASTFYQTHWSARLDAVAAMKRDGKTRLQEWAQAQGLGTPEYVVLSRDGPDHAPTFVLEVRVDGRKPCQGTGGSKRDAEQVAAEKMLNEAGVND